MKFSDCQIEVKKNWRGHEQQKFISGYHAKKYEVQCSLALSMKKRQVVLEKELKNIRTFEDYFEYCLKDSHKSFVLTSKIEKNSIKKIKASIWGAKNFPMNILDLMPLLELLASVSQKARRFNEFLSSAEGLQQIGFPVRAKIPLFLTVTALVVFKDLKIGNIDSKEFEIENIEAEILFRNYECQRSLSIIVEDCDEECEAIGPKVKLNPPPKLQDEESETTFIREFINIGEEIKEKVKAVELHTIIISKIKKFIENNQNTSNDIDVVIL